MKKAAGVENSLKIPVLSVGPREEDHTALSRIFMASEWPLCPGSRWSLEASLTVPGAVAALKKTKPPLVVCQRDLGTHTWRDLWEQAASLPDPPALIVTSRLADEQLWAEALNFGVYDVLAQPFDAAEVVRTLSQAWLHRAHRPRRAVTAVGHPKPAAIRGLAV